jgi:hypothetical protein
MNPTHVYIVGAGFSMYAGLPLQKDFTEALLEPRADEPHSMPPLVQYLRRFVHDAFDHGETAKARFWPNLEDVFTNIDMAANTGHHLGSKHAPSDLRTTRRVLLARMIRMLDERYASAESVRGEEWRKLDRFFNGLDLNQSAFISINWDTVIERKLAELRGVTAVDYGCEAIAASFPKRGNVIEKRELPAQETVTHVVKIHGSVNWLYCDNCRDLYWLPMKDEFKVAAQLVGHEEGKHLGLANLENCAKWRCSDCSEVPLTTRIATFSYLKALDFPMFEKSWLVAERLLRTAKKWIFIGYSLPAADYEFKHLLKRVQLSRAKPPEFLVITGGPRDATEATYHNYQHFFGRGIRRDETFLDEGLTRSAIRAANK